MTKAQNSFLAAIPDVLKLIEVQISHETKLHLRDLLDRNISACDATIWGIAINQVINHGGSFDNLIIQLSEQAADNALIMSKIVGWDATIILLRLYNEYETSKI